MADFDSNPDIDEKPPIPLRDALEKMKPFLMQYEGIQSQEEWEVNQSTLALMSYEDYLIAFLIFIFDKFRFWDFLSSLWGHHHTCSIHYHALQLGIGI